MTPSEDGIIYCRECSLKQRTADGSTRTIERYDNVSFVFRSGNGLVRVMLTNVAHLPDIRYYLFCLPTLVKNGHGFEAHSTGIVVKLKSECSITFPLTRNVYSF